MSGPSSNFLDPLLSPTHQDDGLDMIRRKNINFIGFTLTDNPTTNATDIVGAGGGVTHGTADQALVTNGAGTASLFAKIVNANVDAAAAIVLSKLGQTSATTGQVVTWSGTAWIAATPAAGTGGVAPGTNGQVLATVGGVVTWRTVGGDITGAPDAIVVGKVKGTTVTTAGGALTTGQSLRVTGAAAADWGPVDLANANAVTGTLPVGSLPSLAGDVTGTLPVNTVAKVRGATIGTAAGALAVGLVLTTTGASSADWLPAANFAIGTADQALVTNGAGSASTWAKIVNANVDAAAGIVLSKLGQSSATSGQVPSWNGSTWVPVTIAVGLGSITPGTNGQVLATVSGAAAWATAAGDVTGAPSAFVVGKVRGTTVTTAGGALTTGQSLRATGVATSDWGPIDIANANAITGALPLASVAQGGATSGQVLAWSGSAWAPAAPTVGAASVAPGTNGQIFATVAGASAWATAGGDVTGAPSAFVTIGLTGTAGAVAMHASSITWDRTVSSAALTHTAQNTDAATSDFTITSQGAMPGAATNVLSGNIILAVPAPATGAGASGNHGHIKLKVSGDVQACFGRHNSEPTAGMFWLGRDQTGTPASHLYSVQTESVLGATHVNAPSATGYVGLALQAIEYFAAGYSILDTDPGAYFFQNRAAKLFVQRRAGDNACFDLTIAGQRPSSTAVGATNNSSGNIVYAVQTPGAGGSAGRHSVTVAGTEIMHVGSNGVTVTDFSAAGIVHNSSAGLLSSSLVVNADVSASAAIAVAKLAAGSNGDFLTTAGGVPVWASISGLGGVPVTRTLTGTAPITVAGDNSPHDLSLDRTIAITDATTAALGSIKLASDLRGTGLLPTVIGLTGIANVVEMHGITIQWDSGAATPTITQAIQSGDGAGMTIQAQSSSGADGGSLTIGGGSGSPIAGSVAIINGTGQVAMLLSPTDIQISRASVLFTTVSSPVISQIPRTAAGVGTPLLVMGQSCTGSATTGANAIFASGLGNAGLGSAAGKVILSWGNVVDALVIDPTTDTITSEATTIRWAADVVLPALTQLQATSGNGTSMAVAAQSGFGTGNTNGGSLILKAGTKNSAGIDGDVAIWNGASVGMTVRPASIDIARTILNFSTDAIINAASAHPFVVQIGGATRMEMDPDGVLRVSNVISGPGSQPGTGIDLYSTAGRPSFWGSNSNALELSLELNNATTASLGSFAAPTSIGLVLFGGYITAFFSGARIKIPYFPD